MSRAKFYGLIALLLAASIVLIGIIRYQINHIENVSSLLITHIINILGCYVIVGFGLGIPLIFFASILGPLQIFLLWKGYISPHLVRADFFHVLKILFSKL